MKISGIFIAVSRVTVILFKSILKGDFSWLVYLPYWLKTLLPGSSSLKEKIPWVNFKAISWLNKYLKKDMAVFEFGSGGSTLFFAERVKKVISVEHTKEWHRMLINTLKKEKIKNCSCFLVLPQKNKRKPSRLEKSYFSSNKSYNNYNFKKYVLTIEKYQKKSFDLIIIDGRARSACIKHSINKIRSGGYLLLDNSQRKEYTNAISKYLSKYDKKTFEGIMPFNCSYLGTTTIWHIK